MLRIPILDNGDQENRNSKEDSMRSIRRIALALVATAFAVAPAVAGAHGQSRHGSSDHQGRSQHRHHHYSGHGGGGGNGNPGGGNSGPDPLSTASLMATIDQYGSSPNHSSGTQATWSEENNVAEGCRADGLQVNSIAYHFPKFVPTNYSLITDSHDVAATALAPLLYSGTTGPHGIEAPLEAAANGTIPAHAAGQIVSVSTLSKGTVAASVPNAIAAGAKAEVFVTKSLGDLPAWEDVNSRQGTGTLPVLL